ncbi:U3 small nucleolar RNA-associated protein [Wickerhamomyces ciferrii]|uniref:U3 small nucleolar RNA-associated protein n=1 Tax=Wickerhamomyces ciferrii (strain ATCC 14091 / BCRC 22168 / CBS 111 / JCM 3599 / NBRC 0793 / NRRL Y-1031 F-60-10) TaxID=1206466 RepID=K0K9J4_WICCF|nr:U3 small nucleolar RNA-associated protein [Wickerhamomyces ciferrii]CCH41585.1 U3 small nucleolar RNA-associated protein [Wickerhamomyces ciferrii]
MSLSEPFTLTKLPRVSGVKERCTITKNSDADTLNVGISGASISKYILKPSPKLAWSHSLPPSSVVTALDENNEVYYAGVFNKTKKSHSVLVVEKLENDSKVLQEIELESKIIDLKYSVDRLYVVTENSIISFQDNKDKLTKYWENKGLYTAIYSNFINDEVILTVEFNAKKNNINYRLISIEGNEVNSKILESKTKFSNLRFTYSNGTLYQQHENIITLLRLPHFIETKSVDLDELSIPFKGKNITLASPAIDRLIITSDQDVYFINTNFNIVLNHITSPKSKVEILFTTQAQPKSYHNSLFGVLLKDNDLSGISITLDSNTLRDSLGKRSSTKSEKSAQASYKVVPSILDIKDEEIDISSITKSKNFDDALLTFLGAENDYYTEKDKVVSSSFINAIVSHIFEFRSDKLPERALTYLLTHPLLPTIDGLLDLLRSKPRLLRQAIVTANVSIKELNKELNITENDEIFKDIITRLLEFPKDKLNFKDLESNHIVERILSLDFGYGLISLLIDSSGIFTWSDELIVKLQDVLSRKIDALDSASNLVAVVDQIELKHFKTVKKVPAYSIEQLSI